MKKLTASIIGYGNRGSTYAKFALEHPDKIEVVAVVEPQPAKKLEIKANHGLSDDVIFDNWSEFTKLPKMSDFVIISNQDGMHHQTALACIEKGYDILLEKPIAQTARQCKEITEAAEKKGVKILVCHVLRYTPFYCMLKDIIDSGAIGDVMSIDSIEGVGNIHQSHSFVRGNWGNSEKSSPMILAKSCHDTDIIQWLIGKKCKKVHSFGSLSFFNKAHKPEGSPDYCVKGCPAADECPYNAIKLYYDDKDNVWFRSVAAKTTENPSDDEVMKAITDGPYGRCVFSCDNDVVDHQVVNMEFEGGCTVAFSMNAFAIEGRRIKIFGTKGEISGYMERGIIDVHTFSDGKTKKYDMSETDGDTSSGHSGGDDGIMNALTDYFNGERVSKSVCDIRTSYLNHIIAFAAEKSRLSGEVVLIDEFEREI